MRLLPLLLWISLVPLAFAGGDEKDGWELFRQRNYAGALERFEVDVNQYPEWAELRDAIGWCHFYLGEYEDATKDFEAALKHKADYKWSLEGLAAISALARAPLEEAAALLEAGQYQEARAAYQRIQEGQKPAPTDSRAAAIAGEGWCLYYLERYREAIKCFRDARKKDPRSVDTLRGLAWCEYASGDYRRALTSLQLSFDSEPDHYQARLTAGWCFYFTKAYDKALAEFGRAASTTVGAWGALSGIGWCELRRGNDEAALAAFRTGLGYSPYVLGTDLIAEIERRPEWRGLHTITGWSALRADLSSWALEEFQTAARLDQDRAETLSGEAFALFRMGRYAEAEVAAAAAKQAGEDETPRYFPVWLADGSVSEVALNLNSLKGWIAQRQGDYDAAVALFREVRRAYPTWPDAACGEGWALYALGNYPAAEGAFQSALELLPGYDDAQSGVEAVSSWRYADYERAWELLLAGDSEGARLTFERIRNDTRGPFPRINVVWIEASLGWVAMRAGDSARAVELYQSALVKAPGLGLAERGWGVLLMEQEAWKEAAEHLQRALADPTLAENAEVWAALGRAQLESRALRKAEVSFERAVAIDPAASTLAGQALLYARTGRHVEARIALERAVASDPSVADDVAVRAEIERVPELGKVHSPLAWAWFYRGSYDRARPEFKWALERDPLEASAPRGYGLTLLRLGELKQGRRVLDEWLAEKPKYENPWGIWSSTLSEYAWTLYAVKDYGDALKAFRELAGLHKGRRELYADPFDGLGWCYLQMGKDREAKSSFLDAIAIDPRYEKSLLGLETLLERD